MIIDFRSENTWNILNSIVDDDDYSDRIFDLVLMGWAVKKSPCNIFPGIWEHKSPYPDLIPVAEEMTRIANLVSETINEPPKKYAWWFALFSDHTGCSIDFVYPSDRLNPQCENDGGKSKVVYGIDKDFGTIYINSHDDGIDDDWFAYLVLETSVKHWCMKQIP